MPIAPPKMSAFNTILNIIKLKITNDTIDAIFVIFIVVVTYPYMSAE